MQLIETLGTVQNVRRFSTAVGNCRPASLSLNHVGLTDKLILGLVDILLVDYALVNLSLEGCRLRSVDSMKLPHKLMQASPLLASVTFSSSTAFEIPYVYNTPLQEMEATPEKACCGNIPSKVLKTDSLQRNLAPAPDEAADLALSQLKSQIETEINEERVLPYIKVLMTLFQKNERKQRFLNK